MITEEQISVRGRDVANLAFALDQYHQAPTDESAISCLAGYALLLIQNAEAGQP